MPADPRPTGSSRKSLVLGAVLVVALLGLGGPAVAGATGSSAAPTPGATQLGPAANSSPVWSYVPTSVAPSPRYSTSFAYDPAANEAVLFGGATTPTSGGDVPFGDTWLFTNGTWKNITSSLSVAPSPRTGAAFVYDPLDHDLILFGGLGGVNARYVLNDTWKFQGGHWTNLTRTVGPSPRSDAAMTYDPGLESVVLFGGCLNPTCSVGANDLWKFQHSRWSHLPESGVRPKPRADTSFAYDPNDQKIILFGGWTTAQRYSDTWELNPNGSWTKLHPAAHPSPRLAATMVWDPSTNSMVLYGGKYLGAFYNDTWEFKNGIWSDLTKRLPGNPGDRGYEYMTFDPWLNAVVVFGGQTWFPGTLNDTWLFS